MLMLDINVIHELLTYYYAVAEQKTTRAVFSRQLQQL